MLIRTLLAVLLALALPATAEDDAERGAILLVAKPGLPDPNFNDSVVLVTKRGAMGALGVIINRPTSIPLAKVFPEIERLRGREEKLHFGGPVARMQVVFVFRAAAAPEDAVRVIDGVYLSSDGEALRRRLEAEAPGDGLRVYAGHAGWAPGQLEAEIERGDWRLLRAEAAAIFSRKPEGLWPELDRRASLTTALHAR